LILCVLCEFTNILEDTKHLCSIFAFKVALSQCHVFENLII
jgi:hypothetical protein